MKTVVKTVKDLGNVVRVKRKQDGFTQVSLAEMLGMGDRVLRELERGKETIQLGKALEILHGLGLELSVRARGED